MNREDMEVASERVLETVRLYTGENRITTDRLCGGAQISGEQLRAVVNALRRQGHEIGSDRRGYFWATEPDDLNTTIEHLGGRYRSIKKVCDALLETRHRMRLMQVEAIGRAEA